MVLGYDLACETIACYVASRETKLHYKCIQAYHERLFYLEHDSRSEYLCEWILNALNKIATQQAPVGI